MFRTIRATFTHRFFSHSFAATTIAATLALSLAAIGCGSSSDTTAATTPCALAGEQAQFSAKSGTTSGCHGSKQPAAGLDLMSAGLAERLVGKGPVAGAGGFQPSMCVGANRIYLTAGSNPATGLLLDKVSPNQPCGARMPIGSVLNNNEMACLRSWALSVTSPSP